MPEHPPFVINSPEELEALYNEKLQKIIETAAACGKADVIMGVLLGFYATFQSMIPEQAAHSLIQQIAELKKQAVDRAQALELHGGKQLFDAAGLASTVDEVMEKYRGKTQ